MPRFTCPHCFREYDKNEVRYACRICKQISKPSLLERGKRAIPCKSKAPGANSPCGGVADVRICPYCGMEPGGTPFYAMGDDTGVIPFQALETKNVSVSIVGVAGSGKTNYITMMIDSLTNGHIPGLRLTVTDETPYTRDHQQENKSAIYDDHIVPEATLGGVDPKPQFWQIKNLNRRVSDRVPTLTLTIYDGAGENHENLDTTSNLSKYIGASNGIILTVDPLILPHVARSGFLNQEALHNSLSGQTKSSADKVIQNMADYIKLARNAPLDKLLDVPVAVVLTKFDVILSDPNIPQNATVRSPSLAIRNGRLYPEEFQKVDEEIRLWLYASGEESFITALSANFQKYQFFGVSSFGAAPPRQGATPEQITPHRVLDPILWLLGREKFID